ncbi:MAG: hypothetical protein ABL963_02565 [Longimicrobiales bacterium]
MISRFMLDPDAMRAFPRDLLDGSRETVRMAERIVRQMGFTDFEYGPGAPPWDRLAWAIMALEEEAPDSEL